MAQPLEERRPPITPQLAVRVAVLGGIALVLFAVVFFRLWFLQVLSSEDYIVQARENRVRKERIEAPRGDIVDRSGDVRLVTTKRSPTVVIQPNELPPPGLPRRRLYRKLGRVLGMSARRVQAEVLDQRKQLPYADVRLKTDVDPSVKNYIKERQDEFPGVDVKPVYLRLYPHKTLAAQLFGSTREISPEELKLNEYKDLDAGARIGVGGIEAIYDQYLRGIDGYQRYQINALGQRKDEPRAQRVKQPVQGQRLRLSLDFGLQAAAAQAVKRGIDAANAGGSGADAGAYVALNPYSGEVYALGSYPSYDANDFAKPISTKRFKEIEQRPGKPMYNRALAGIYPTGSTFKPIVAAAALQSGALKSDEQIFDDGVFKLGPQEYKNARGARYGALEITKALQVSSDVFFYTLGNRLNYTKNRPIQTWARKLGLGKRTGIDLPGEFAGFVPDARNVNRAFQKTKRCADKLHIPVVGLDSLYKCGGIQDAWTAGDNVNLAVGQGYLQATPLQMAVAYSAILNGGSVVTPRLGLAVEDGSGQEIQKIDPAPRRKLGIDPANLGLIKDGLRKAAMEPGGTSYDVFKGFPRTVYGKTGTVERPGQNDQSWYVAGVLDENPENSIVVAVTIEKGGFGAEAAAPAARLILSDFYDVRKVFKVGSSQDG